MFVYNDVDKAGADYVDFWPLEAPFDFNILSK